MMMMVVVCGAHLLVGSFLQSQNEPNRPIVCVVQSTGNSSSNCVCVLYLCLSILMYVRACVCECVCVRHLNPHPVFYIIYELTLPLLLFQLGPARLDPIAISFTRSVDGQITIITAPQSLDCNQSVYTFYISLPLSFTHFLLLFVLFT